MLYVFHSSPVHSKFTTLCTIYGGKNMGFSLLFSTGLYVFHSNSAISTAKFTLCTVSSENQGILLLFLTVLLIDAIFLRGLFTTQIFSVDFPLKELALV